MDSELEKRAHERADVIWWRFLKSSVANGDPFGELEKMAIDLAETCMNPEEFGAALEILAPFFVGIFYKKEEQIGMFPFLIGMALDRLSYLDLAAKSKDLALKYSIKFDDKTMTKTLEAKRATPTRTETSNRDLSTRCDLTTITPTWEYRDSGVRSDFLRFKFFSLANDYQRLGNSEKATRYYEKSLEIAKKIGDRTLEAKCLAMLCNKKDR